MRHARGTEAVRLHGRDGPEPSVPPPSSGHMPDAGPGSHGERDREDVTRYAAPTLSAAAALCIGDAAMATLAWLGAVVCLLNTGAIAAWPPPLPLLLHPVGFVLALYALGLYRRDALIGFRRAMGRVPLAAGLGAGGAFAVTALLPAPLGASGGPALFGGAVLAFTFSAVLARGVFFLAFRRGAFRRRLLVIGAGQRAWELALLLAREGRTVAQEIAFVHDARMGELDPRLAEEHGASIINASGIGGSGGFLSIAHAFRADQIVVAADERRGMPMTELLACRTAGYPVHEHHRFLEQEIGRIDLKRLDMGALLYSDGFTFSVIDLTLKRLLDIVASAAVLALASPFLALAALAVKLEDGGPVLYRQARVTRGGRVFRIMKLRTMTVDAEAAGAVWAAKRDPRVTRVGRFLRRSRLDELPQLVNVLRGEMSFVGPRPERPEFTAELARALPLYEERHLVRAGLTGWAQVNYPYGASLDDARSKLSYDLYYVKNFSVLFDVMIILQTIRVVLWPQGGAR